MYKTSVACLALLIAWPFLSVVGHCGEPLFPAQQWESVDGKKITAAVLSVDDTNVVFLMRGKQFTYPIDKLSPSSQDTLKAAQASRDRNKVGTAIKFLCIRANFADRKIYVDKLDQWADDLADLFEFSEPYYRLQSYGQIGSMPFRVTEVCSIDRSWAEYKGKEHELSLRMRAMAQEAGWKLDQYDHVVLSFPSIEGNYGALGTPGTIWIPGEKPWPPGFAHELGHAFSIGHAGSWEGGQKSWPAVHDEGSDAYFTMGSGAPGAAWNLPMKVKKNWVEESQLESIQVGSKAVYRLFQFDVPKLTSKGPVGLRAKDFWLSYAPNQLHWIKDGVPREVVERGLFIHTLHGELTRLVDSNPASRQNPDRQASHLDPFHDAKDAPLVVGKTLTIDRTDVLPHYRLKLKPLRVGGRTGERWMDVEVDLQEDGHGDPLIASDSFVEVSSDLVGTAGGKGWAGRWRREAQDKDLGVGKAKTIAPGLSYLNLQCDGGSLNLTAPTADNDTLVVARKLSHTLGTPGTSIWCSFLLKAEQPKIGDLLLTLGDNFNLSIGKPWGEHWGIYITHSKIVMQAAQPHLVVASFEFHEANCTVRMWVDPASLANPSNDNAIATRTDRFEPSDEIKLRLQGHGHGEYVIDEIRLGTSFNSVVPTVSKN